MEDDDCKSYVLTKKYYEIDELESDNNKTIYYDKEYDKTYYELLNEYDNVFENDVTKDEMINLLAEKIKEDYNVKEKESLRTAKTLIEGKKEVEEGEYAFVIVDNERERKNYYYKRVNDIWVKDDSVGDNQFIDENKMFCNLNEKCINIKDNCKNYYNARLDVGKSDMKGLLNNFENMLDANKSVISEMIKYNTQMSKDRLLKLKNMKKNKLYKFNNSNYELGMTVTEMLSSESPYSKLRDVILGQGDFIKKQNDVVRFVKVYTRTNEDDEDPMWLYCIKTNTKLLPSFLSKMALAFVNNDNYEFVTEKICAEQGTLSDDGDRWVDKYSGYTITNINYDTEEGFTDEGRKKITRSILEEDIGNALLQRKTNVYTNYKNAQAEKIINIVKALSGFMGIDVKTELDYIIRNTLKLQDKIIPTKEIYEKQMKKLQSAGKLKNYDKYDLFYNQSLIIITVSYYLIVLVTSIPQINSRKRHPGCVRSFRGFPLTGIEDKSGLIYIACICNKIKSSIEPWNSLSKLNENILIEKIELTINKFIINDFDVQEKIKTKLNYISLNKDEFIPEELNIKNLTNFLPPLNKIVLNTIEELSNEFIKNIKVNIKTGSRKQYHEINILQSKIIFYSLKIQELIENTVTKKKPILSNVNDEPFLENACCDDGTINTYDYFSELEPDINKYNNYVGKLRTVLEDIKLLGTASILYDPTDTKLKYPEMSNEFSEEVIYQAFIVYCNFNNNLPLNEELRAICMDKPDNFEKNKDIKDNIQLLKDSGRNYTKESFDNLLTIVNRKNKVEVNLNTISVSNIQKMRDILNYMDEINNVEIPQVFRENLKNLIDVFEIGGLTEDNDEMRVMKNYLSISNDNLTNEITKFILENSSSKVNEKIKMCIKDITQFVETGNNVTIEKVDETIYKMINFIKNTTHTITRIFPNMVINKVDYNDVNIPKYWKLSDVHNTDLKLLLNKHYSKLYKLYDDSDIEDMLQRTYYKMIDIEKLMNYTEYFAPIKIDDKKYYTIFDGRMCIMLFKYYFLSILKIYISVLDETDIITRNMNMNLEETEESEWSPSVDLIEEEQQGIVTNIEIASGEKKKLSQKLADTIHVFLEIICNDKEVINYNYDTLFERILRSKEKEKTNITDFLKELTDEEREIENLFKNNKLERWSKGLQKGLRIYDKNTYDEEREELEQIALKELKLGKNDAVTNMNRDIYYLDLEYNETIEDEINNEVNDLGLYVGENDEIEDVDMDLDGDEYY